MLDFIMKSLKPIETDDLDLHIIYSGLTYIVGQKSQKEHDFSKVYHSFPFYAVIYQMMQKYNIKSILFTMITMFKGQLVTKELMKKIIKVNSKKQKISTLVTYRFMMTWTFFSNR